MTIYVLSAYNFSVFFFLSRTYNKIKYREKKNLLKIEIILSNHLLIKSNYDFNVLYTISKTVE